MARLIVFMSNIALVLFVLPLFVMCLVLAFFTEMIPRSASRG